MIPALAEVHRLGEALETQQRKWAESFLLYRTQKDRTDGQAKAMADIDAPTDYARARYEAAVLWARYVANGGDPNAHQPAPQGHPAGDRPGAGA